MNLTHDYTKPQQLNDDIEYINETFYEKNIDDIKKKVLNEA